MAKWLRAATQSEFVYVYVFGGSIPHRHVHLAPHRNGDALNSQMIKGEIVSEQMKNGFLRFVSKDYPPLPREVLEEAALRIKQQLNR